MATPFMVFVIPTPGPGGTPGPLWAQQVNTALQTIDAHDHTPGKGVPISVASLLVTQDLSFASFGITDLSKLVFTSVGSPFVGTNLISVVNGELFYNDGAGNQIQITAGGGLNAASIGGIGGDYVGSGASVFYTSSVTTFSFTSAPGVPAAINAGDIKITSADGTNTVTISNPNTGSSFTLNLMDSLPAANSLVALTSAGALQNALIDTASLTYSAGTISVRNIQYEARFLANGSYRVGNGVDGSSVLPYNYEIINVYASSDTVGTSGTTEADIQVQSAPGGPWTSIFSTTPKFSSTSASGAYTQVLPAPPAQTGVTAPVLSTTNLIAGSRIRMNIVQAMTRGRDLTVSIQLKVRV
jgi:hypothetical protein